MLRMSKLTDYGMVVLAEMARSPSALFSAAELAETTGLAVTTVSKLLKSLTKAGILESTRGARGGYALARPPEQISTVDIIDAIEGPVAITECAAGHNSCTIQDECTVGGNWQQINIGIRRALERVSLAELIRPMAIPLIDLRKTHVHQ